MKNSYTCLVAGAGPSGTAAAYTLAKNGIDVCIVDKAIFPREKLCGGGLTRRTKNSFLDVFDLNWEDMYEYSANSALFYYKGHVINKIEDYGELYFCDRIMFDNRLLDQATSRGVDVVPGERVDVIDTVEKTCKLASGRQIRYRYLIGADGVNSVVARQFVSRRINRNRYAYALQVDIHKDDYGKKELTRPELYFGDVAMGYGWVFPKRNSYTVGICSRYSKTVDARKKMMDFFADRNGAPFKGRLKGHYIPFGNYAERVVENDMILVGDAAGLVDPVTGEGIAYAIESGYHAAVAVIAAVSGKNCNIEAVYKKKILQRDLPGVGSCQYAAASYIFQIYASHRHACSFKIQNDAIPLYGSVVGGLQLQGIYFDHTEKNEKTDFHGSMRVRR